MSSWLTVGTGPVDKLAGSFQDTVYQFSKFSDPNKARLGNALLEFNSQQFKTRPDDMTYIQNMTEFISEFVDQCFKSGYDDIALKLINIFDSYIGIAQSIGYRIKPLESEI